MFSKRLLTFSIVLITVTQAYAFSVEQTKPASPDANSAVLNGLEEVNKSIRSSQTKIQKIKDSIDTAISETKRRHARETKDATAVDPDELRIAELKVSLVKDVLKEIRDNPILPQDSPVLLSYTPDIIQSKSNEWFRMNITRKTANGNDVIDIMYVYASNTIFASKYRAFSDDKTRLEVAFKYPSKVSPVEQAMQEVRKIKSKKEPKELINLHVKEIRELADVQNSIGVLDQYVGKIRRMFDVNSVNIEQIRQEIDNLDKKITNAELTTQSEILRISDKYQRANFTNSKANETQLVQQKPQDQAQSAVQTAKKAVLIVPAAQFADAELFETQRILNEAGIASVVASSKMGELQGVYGGIAASEITLDNLKVEDYEAVVFIGGPGAADYFNNPAVLRIVREASARNKVIAAISDAPMILSNAGVLRGIRATCLPQQREQMKKAGAQFTGSAVERDGLIITANDSSVAVQFARAIVTVLKANLLKPDKTPTK